MPSTSSSSPEDGWLRTLRGSASVGVASAGIVGGTAVTLRIESEREMFFGFGVRAIEF